MPEPAETSREPDTAHNVADRAAVLADAYPIWLCDVWGVIHDGENKSPAAVDALQRFRQQGGFVVLITNAPRPAASVATQLEQFSVPRDAYDVIVTSGDVTRALLDRSGLERVFHLGPERDQPFFAGLPLERVSLSEAQAVVCTGLYEDDTETPDDYHAQLTDLYSHGLAFYCANPDLMVQRGDRLVYCAGALAEIYHGLGGEVIIAGKPHAPIYDAVYDAVEKHRGTRPSRRDVLAIGDGIKTDMTGAANQGLDAVFIAGGIHAGEATLQEVGGPGAQLKATTGVAVVGAMTTLQW